MANDILAHPTAQPKQSAGSQCADAIKELLANGSMLTNDFEERLAGQGHSVSAIKQGRKAARVESLKEHFSGAWKVRLSGAHEEAGQC